MGSFGKIILYGNTQTRLTGITLDVLHLIAYPYIFRSDSIITTTLFLSVEQSYFNHSIKKFAHKVIEKSRVLSNPRIFKYLYEVIAIPCLLVVTTHYCHIKHFMVLSCMGCTNQFWELHTTT